MLVGSAFHEDYMRKIFRFHWP